jgi:hypothetical protein
VVREARVIAPAAPGACARDEDCEFISAEACRTSDDVCAVQSLPIGGSNAERSRINACGSSALAYQGPCSLPLNMHPACIAGHCDVAPGAGTWLTNACTQNADCAIYRNCPVCRTDGKCEYAARSIAAQKEYSRLQRGCGAVCGALGLCNLPTDVRAACTAGTCSVVHQHKEVR